MPDPQQRGQQGRQRQESPVDPDETFRKAVERQFKVDFLLLLRQREFQRFMARVVFVDFNPAHRQLYQSGSEQAYQEGLRAFSAKMWNLVQENADDQTWVAIRHALDFLKKENPDA